jgi:undecaprenyl-diphosphatase
MTISTSADEPSADPTDQEPVRLSHDDVLSDPAGGLAGRIAWQARHRHPVTAGLVVALIGLVVMGAVIAGLGMLLTHVLLDGGLGGWDERVNDWFVTQRTSTLNGVTAVGTTIGSTATVVAVATLAVLVLAVQRLWREAGLIVTALCVEVLVFLMTTVVVNRPRPTVVRLDPSPPTSSFPSGHTAAAIALWVSLAIVVSMHVKSATVRILVWLLALGLPAFVAVSRLYRGMHHPTDVLASLILGAGAVTVALLAVRTASEVDDIRHSSTAGIEPARVEVAS